MNDTSGPAGAGIFRLGWADLARGLVVAVLSAVLTYLYSGLLGDGTLDLAAIDWQKVGGISLAATAAYLLKNLVSDETGKVLGKFGAWAAVALLAVGLSACTPSQPPQSAGGGVVTPPQSPCEQAQQRITYATLAVATSQTGYALLVATGAIKPKPETASLIDAGFAAASNDLVQAQADRDAGRCDVTAAILRANQALGVAAAQIAQERVAAEAAMEAEKKAKHVAKAKTTP